MHLLPLSLHAQAFCLSGITQVVGWLALGGFVSPGVLLLLFAHCLYTVKQDVLAFLEFKQQLICS